VISFQFPKNGCCALHSEDAVRAAGRRLTGNQKRSDQYTQKSLPRREADCTQNAELSNEYEGTPDPSLIDCPQAGNRRGGGGSLCGACRPFALGKDDINPLTPKEYRFAHNAEAAFNKI
jgi:hypothetical protein